MTKGGRDKPLWTVWCILQAIGIRITNPRSPNDKPVFWKLCPVLCLISILTSFSLSIYVNIHFRKNTGIVMNSVVIYILATFMYCSLARQGKYLEKLRKVLLTLPSKYQKSAIHFIINISALMAFLYPIMNCVLAATTNTETLKFTEHSRNPWVLAAARIFYFVSVYADSFYGVTMPLSINCILFALTHHFQKVISLVSYDMLTFKSEVLSGASRLDERGIRLLQRYRVLCNGTFLMKEIFSYVLLFMLLMLGKNIWGLTTWALSGTVTYVSIVGTQLIVYIFFFVGTMYAASRLTQEMENLAFTLREINEDITFKYDETCFRMFSRCAALLLERKPVVLSVGGFFDINYSLILAAAGSLASFCYLFITRPPNTWYKYMP